MRYIIALTPTTSSFYIKISEELFQDVFDDYILSETVKPHITVTQFETDNAIIAKEIWEKVESLNIQKFTPKMIGIGIIKGLKEHKNFYWAQILVERDPIIVEVHYQILKILKEYSLLSMIDSGDIYKPHLTLARIKLLKPIPLWTSEILDPTTFNITLGESDQNGRYLKKLYGS